MWTRHDLLTRRVLNARSVEMSSSSCHDRKSVQMCRSILSLENLAVSRSRRHRASLPSPHSPRPRFTTAQIIRSDCIDHARKPRAPTPAALVLTVYSHHQLLLFASPSFFSLRSTAFSLSHSLGSAHVIPSQHRSRNTQV